MKTEYAIIAAHYADAVMQLAVDAGADRTILQDLESVNQVISQQPEFEIILKHPSVAPHDKKQLIISIFGGKVSELTLRLLEMLADKRRLDLLPHIETEYRKLWRERQNIMSGTLYYAEKPEASVIEEMKAKLQASLGKQLELEEKEDKSLIGGFLLQFGDQVIDGSLKGRLQTIEKQLLSV